MDNCVYEELRDEPTVKKRAQSVKSRLKDLGHEVPLSHVYEAMATMLGHRNWPTMKASLKSSTSHSRGVRSQGDASAHLVATVLTNASGEPLVYDQRQDCGAQLIYGPPGKGKTTLSQALDWERFKDNVSGQMKSLPQTTIIDIFGSSKAMMDRLKAELPEDRRASVRYLKLKDDRSQSINVFDTPLGLRTPTCNHRLALANFLVGLVCTTSDYQRFNGLHMLSLALVDRAYLRFSDFSLAATPKPYVVGSMKSLDAIIQASVRTKCEDAVLNWWQVVDALYESGNVDHAVLAQRYAVPTLEDIVDLIANHHDELKDGDITYKHLGDLMAAIKVHIASFPLRSEPTNIPDVGRVEVLAIDHSAFSKRHDRIGVRQVQSSVLISRLLATRDMFIRMHDIRNCPRLYRMKYEFECLQNGGRRASFVYEDIHFLGTLSVAFKQIATDCVNSVTDKVSVRLSTQTLVLFQTDIVGVQAEFLKSVDTLFVLGVTEHDVPVLQSVFRVSDEWVQRCKSQLIGPTADGLDLVVCDSKGGCHQVKLAVSSESLWENASRSEDVALRDIVVSEVGHREAIARLSKRFRRGTAAFEFESRLRDRGSDADVISVIETIANEVLMFA